MSLRKKEESPTDEKITQELKELLADIYDTYIKFVYDYIWYNVHHIDTIAEDLTQDVFLLSVVKANIMKVLTHRGVWLLKTAHNMLMRFFTFDKRERSLFIPLSEANQDSMMYYDHRHNNIDIFQSYVNKQEFLMLKLMYIHGYRVKDIAKILKITESACVRRFQRVYNKIKKGYDQYD